MLMSGLALISCSISSSTVADRTSMISCIVLSEVDLAFAPLERAFSSLAPMFIARLIRDSNLWYEQYLP